MRPSWGFIHPAPSPVPNNSIFLFAHHQEGIMQYDMVFEGGGAKGMVFVGALEVFMSAGHTYGRLLGTSAGAITASLLAAGYRPEEMLQSLSEKVEGRSVFADFMAVPLALDKAARVTRFDNDIDLNAGRLGLELC